MNWTAFLNVILLIAALTTDSFVVSFSYGAQNVKMSMKMILVMNLVMSLLLAGGICTGRVMEVFFPGTLLLLQVRWSFWEWGDIEYGNSYRAGEAGRNRRFRNWIISREFYWPLFFPWTDWRQASAQDWYRPKRGS